MVKKNGSKKRINLLISRDLLEDLNHHLVDTYGNVFGHIGKSLEESLRFWLEEQKKIKKADGDENSK